jgi:hypothetical protein
MLKGNRGKKCVKRRKIREKGVIYSKGVDNKGEGWVV